MIHIQLEKDYEKEFELQKWLHSKANRLRCSNKIEDSLLGQIWRSYKLIIWLSLEFSKR